MPPLDTAATGKDDWITAPAASAEKDDWITAPKAGPMAVPMTAPVGGEFGDLSAQPWAQGSQPDPNARAPIAQIADAAVQGFKETPPIAGPEGQAILDKSPAGRMIVSPALKALGAVPAAWNAVTQAAAEAANQVTGNPDVGRDLMAAMQILPIMHGAVPPRLSAAPPSGRPSGLTGFPDVDPAPVTMAEVQAQDGLGPLDAAQRARAENATLMARVAAKPATVADIGKAPDIDTAIAAAADAAQAPAAPYTPVTATQVAARDGIGIDGAFARARAENDNAGSQSEPGATTPAGTPQTFAEWRAAQEAPPDAPVSPPVGDAVPQSVGAAASREGTADTTFGRTAREITGAQADMELSDLMKTPQAGDARDIIPGATQTRAEIELSPSVSREAKGLRQEFREGFNDHEKENNEIYHKWIDDVVPPREQVGTMKDIRESNWKDDESVAFGLNPNGEPVSAAPVVEHMLAVLADPIEKSNSYLKAAFKPFIDALTDDAGNPITLGAKELYGIRQEMGRKVKDMATDTNLAHVRGQFGDLMNVTDDTITTGAADYRTMMDRYKEASQPINAAERLQDIKMKVTNGSDRVITFGAFDRYMKSLWMERNGPNPYAPAKSIPQETWDHLMQLHERLARSASDQELARTRGSDTTQLMMEMMRKGAIGVSHAVVAKLTGGLGNIAIPYVTKQIDQSRALKRVGQHLNPDLSQYPPVVP